MSPIPRRPTRPAGPVAHLLGLATLAALLLLVGGATVVSAAPAQQPSEVEDELIVVFERETGPNERASAVAQANAEQKQSFPQIRAALVSTEKGNSRNAFRSLVRNPHVSYVQPNYVYEATATPDDPSLGQLWGLHNTGQTGGTPDADIDAPEAWDATTGDPSVVVAVIDTGVDFAHPDLAAQQWVNTGENCGSSDPAAACAERSDGADNDGNGKVDDWRGWDWVSNDNDPFDDQSHGTHVAGTIGAVGNNGTGVAGVNWNVRLMALKFLNSAGSGTTANAIAATLYAADEGARVANNSWGGGPFDQALLDAIEYGAGQGMLSVAAAGNSSADNDATPFYPASYETEAIVSVAATDHNDALASFSHYGAKSVDLGAPGASIFSTTPGGTYGTKSGTSMASPHAAGAAALLAARFPNASPYTLKALLLDTVDPKASLAGRTVTGGRLNVGTAAGCANEPVAWLVDPSPTFGVGVGDAFPIRVIASDCATPVGVGNVTATVNGTTVPLSATSPDRGVYSGSYTAITEGTLTVEVTVSAGGATATDVAVGSAARNYGCQQVAPDAWVDATPYTTLGINLGTFKTIILPFPFTFYGQTYTTVNVSSYGFLSFAASAGSAAQVNTGIPNASLPNGLIAPFWDDLNPGVFGGGRVYGVWMGSAPNRQVTFEWYSVPHTFNVGAATFETTLYESGEIRFRYLDTDFGNAQYNAGASATAGVESPSGTVGKQFSFNQPVLTNGTTVSCMPPTAPAPDPPTITTTDLPDGTRTASYSAALTAAGGTPPYTWSLDAGQLPPGLSLDGATGVISGTPSDSTTTAFTVKVTDAASQSSTKQLELAVADPLQVPADTLPGATVDEAYLAVVSSLGGVAPYTWELAAGSLPPGLSLGPGTSTVSISGTPTAAGTYPFTLRATDGGDPARTATQDFSITVAPAVPALSLTTTTLAGGTVGTAYSQSVTATGGTTPYAWTLLSGSLPPGVGLTSGTPSATLSGTPTAAGTYDFTLQVSDGTQTATQAFQVTVAPQALPVVDSVTYAASGGKQNNKNLVVTVRITRGGSPLANASVSITLRRNGAVYATRVGTTGANGTVAFSFSNYAKGCYVTTVTQVVVSGQASTPSTPANSHCK